MAAAPEEIQLSHTCRACGFLYFLTAETWGVRACVRACVRVCKINTMDQNSLFIQQQQVFSQRLLKLKAS